MTDTIQSVAVIVVTYNRLALLKECLDSLKNLVRKADAIIIVNNASTDGTKEWLATQEGLIILNREFNEGSAGGFYYGMQYAADNNYDWIWVMDDDAAPLPDCLEKMMQSVHTNDPLVMLAPLVKEGNSLINNHRSNFDIRPDLSGFQKPLPKGKEFEPQVIQFASFVGFMIAKKLMDQCGLPNKDLFFQNDDVEYCLRVNKSGKILLVPDAVIEHKFVKKDIEVKKRKLGIFKTNDFTIGFLFVKFFVQRNKILIKRNYFKEHSTFKFFIFYINTILNYIKIFFKIFFLVPFKYKSIFLKLYTKAYVQGLSGKAENTEMLVLIQQARLKESKAV